MWPYIVGMAKLIKKNYHHMPNKFYKPSWMDCIIARNKLTEWPEVAFVFLIASNFWQNNQIFETKKHCINRNFEGTFQIHHPNQNIVIFISKQNDHCIIKIKHPIDLNGQFGHLFTFHHLKTKSTFTREKIKWID